MDHYHLLLALLHHLDSGTCTRSQVWNGWTITPVNGGANNLLYRVTSSGGDFAVKFTVRDDRRRAAREFAALSALHQVGLHLAPQAVWLNEHSYRQPVVVQTWLDGDVLTAPPQTAAEWDALLQHYCTIHTLTPSQTTVPLAEAVLNVASGASGKALVHEHIQRLPAAALPQSLQEFLHWFDLWTPPAWPTPPRALCHGDPNWRNVHRRRGGWGSVDWENSGWGDPAFEIADLITHPAYADLADPPWDWLIKTYGDRMDDQTATLRIKTYYTIMLMWWLVRWTRYLYEIPRGMDARLVHPPADWKAETERKYAQYAVRMEKHVALFD